MKKTIERNKTHYLSFIYSSILNFRKDGLSKVLQFEMIDNNGIVTDGMYIEDLIVNVKQLERFSVVYVNDLDTLYQFIKQYYAKNNKDKDFKEFMNNNKIFALDFGTIKLVNFSNFFAQSISKLVKDVKGFELINTNKEYIIEENTNRYSKYLNNINETMRESMIEIFNEYNDTFRLTIGTYAYEDLKENTKGFDILFPTLTEDMNRNLRKAYFGGINYTNKNFRNKILKSKSIDRNSSYPSEMAYGKLPIGQPVLRNGYIKETENTVCIHKLTIDDFKVKNNAIRLFGITKSKHLKNVDYKSDLMEELQETMYLTSSDLEIFKECYEITNLNVLKTYVFKAYKGIFKEYIENLYNERLELKSKGLVAKQQSKKVKINSLYGKTVQNLEFTIIEETYDKSCNMFVRKNITKENRNATYMPLGIFISSNARRELYNTAVAFGLDNVIYMDTDSVWFVDNENTSLTMKEMESRGTLNNNGLGNWKVENEAEVKVLGSKTYMYIDINGKKTIKASGVNIDHLQKQVKSFDEFKRNMEITDIQKVVMSNDFKGVVKTYMKKQLASHEI